MYLVFCYSSVIVQLSSQMCVSNNSKQDRVDISKLRLKEHAGSDSSSVEFLARTVSQLFWAIMEICQLQTTGGFDISHA